ncbi:hypothetical protein GCM10011586_27080 [Silvibacterium dinghuense]|nr:hypothetical protein GCM10011586_27080 [Silvibacterium dinghuense]
MYELILDCQRRISDEKSLDFDISANGQGDVAALIYAQLP